MPSWTKKWRDKAVFDIAFPRNRGEGLRVRAYANVLLGHALDTQDLVQASRDYEERFIATPQRDWDSIPQAHILEAARMSLISGDLKRAKEVLSIKRSMKWHAEEFQLLKELVAEAQTELPVHNSSLRARVKKFFDRVRDPEYKPNVFMDLPILRLEWGALINKYFETGSHINWSRVIELIAE